MPEFPLFATDKVLFSKVASADLNREKSKLLLAFLIFVV